MSSALLLDEPCIVIQPALVRTLGHLADAAVLQQIHYWLARATVEDAGYRWVYKTYEEWSEEVGISAKQVRSALGRLENLGLVVSCQPEAWQRRKWYRIDYESPILTGASAPEVDSIRPDGPVHLPTRANASAHTGACNTEITTEIPTEITPRETPKSEIDLITSGDVEAQSQPAILAEYLAECIESNLGKRPKVTGRWIVTIERMIRIDGRTPDQVRNAITWATSDDFWSCNILSPEALRKHYDRLRMQAARDRQRSAPKGMEGVRDFLATLEDQPLFPNPGKH